MPVLRGGMGREGAGRVREALRGVAAVGAFAASGDVGEDPLCAVRGGRLAGAWVLHAGVRSANATDGWGEPRRGLGEGATPPMQTSTLCVDDGPSGGACMAGGKREGSTV